MSKRSMRIINAHPNARLRAAEKIGAAARRAEWREKRAKKLRKCPVCKSRFTKSGKTVPTIDHIIPLSKGGKDEQENWQVICFGCNQSKGNGSEPRP